LINYPRFPKEPAELLVTARELAELLRTRLFQHSYTIESPMGMEWSTSRE
jgi:hypothetical protein